MNIGGLTIEMAADLARLRQDMAAAKNSVGDAMVGIEKAVGLAKNAMGALGIGLGVAAITSWVKGAIDAADNASKLAQKAGVATAEVAGLQLAFELGGSSSQGMATAMAKLQKQIVDGNKAFDDMGVKTRNADGTLRGSKDVLYDVADAIAATESNTLKAAMAQEIFGKSGAELLPLLNGGSQGFKDMAETAAALGLVIDSDTGKAAEEFNDTLDLLQRAGGGVANQIAAQMLPALNAAAGGFLEMVKEGQFVDKMAAGLVVTFKLLYTGVMSVMEVFSTLGKFLGGTIARLMAEISGLGEAVVKVFQGDFKGAAESAQKGFQESAAISRDMSADIRKGWQQTGSAISKTWSETQSTTVKALADMEKGTKGATAATKDQEAAQKKAREEMEKATKAGGDWLKNQDAQIKGLKLELEASRALTEGEKALLKLEEDLQSGKVRLTDAELASAKAKLAEADSLRKARQEQEAATKATEAAVAARAKEFDAIEANVLKLDEEIAALRAANETTLTGVDRTQQLAVAKLRDAAASADRQAMIALERKEDEALYDQFKQQAAKLRELAELKEQGVHVQAAKDAADAWTKVTDQIGQGLTDSLFRAFESGKGFFKTLWDGIVNTFKTTALKLIIQGADGKGGFVGSILGTGGSGGSGFGGMMGSIGNGLSAFGDWMGADSTVGGWASAAADWMKGSAASSTGIGSTVLGMMGNFGGGLSAGYGSMLAGNAAGGWSAATTAIGAGNVSGGLGTMGGMAAGAVGGFMAGRGVGQAISNGYSAVGGQSGNSAVNTGAAIGAAIGSIIPGLGTLVGGLIGGALGGLANRAFGHKAKEYNGDKGIEGLLGMGGVTGGSTWAEWTQKGGWFRSDKHGTDTGALDQATADGLSKGAKAVYEQTKEWAAALGLPAERLASVTTSFRVKLTDSEAENQKALAAAFSQYATDLTQVFADVIAPFRKAGESVQDTLQRLSALKTFSDSINEFGGVFSKIASASIEARENLINLAGGIDQLMGASKQFVLDYYSKDEQAAFAARDMLAALKGLGIDGAALADREGFRALVESLGSKLEDETAQKQLVALLALGQQFAPVADYLKEQGTTLADLAAQAPQIEVLQALTAQQATAQSAQLSATEQINTSVVNIGDQIAAGISQLGDALADKLDLLNAAITEGSKRTADAFTYENAR